MDINGDGHLDILSGSYSRMEQPMAGLFQVLWGKADGTFKKAAVLDGSDSKPLIIPIKGNDDQIENICTRPFAVDWTGDGHLDLVVGTFAGSFYLFTGEGSGKFRPTPEAIMVSGRPLKVDGMHSDPFVIDWDGDGDLDLLSGSNSGGVHWAENVAGKGKQPQLKAFTTLIEAGPRIEYGQLLSETDLTGPTASTRIWVDDVNSDGKLDILVGDSVTLISTAKGVSKDEFPKRFSKWQTEINAASDAMNNQGESKKAEAARKRYEELREKRTEFMIEERTGFVWLYVRK